MNERTGQILEAAIQEFINTGEPVSSGRLYEQYDFGIKPAMIRLELDALEDDGYLEQPYHSAGRIPTDNGYEFYAERALGLPNVGSRGKAAPGARNAFANLFERRAWPNLLQELSAQLGLLSVVVDSIDDTIYKSGLAALVHRLDWQDRDGIQSVIRDFESVDERMASVKTEFGDELQVFIGKKSPVTESENLSVVGGNYKTGGATVSIFVIGPKRMDYKKTIRVFKNL